MARKPCSVEGCQRPNVGRGLCHNHYEREYRRNKEAWQKERATRLTTCSVESCNNKIIARGWCSMHYQRWKEHGDPITKLNMRNDPAEERFMAKVDINADGCWMWTGTCHPIWGYGYFSVNGKNVLAHRWAYEHWVGPIPKGMQLDHFACDEPNCVCPWHTRPVTPRENVLRSNGVTAQNAAKTECARGHPFDEMNTIITKDGNRHCRICRLASQREWKARQRVRGESM